MQRKKVSMSMIICCSVNLYSYLSTYLHTFRYVCIYSHFTFHVHRSFFLSTCDVLRFVILFLTIPYTHHFPLFPLLPFNQFVTTHRLVGEVHATLYLILKHCLSFDPFIEEIMDHIRNKKEAPHGRVCMMEFIAVACFEVCVCVCVYECV